MTKNTEVTTPEDGVAYADMTWQKLKSLMNAENQAWVNKDDAVKYLTALDAKDAENVNEAQDDKGDGLAKEGGDAPVDVTDSQESEVDLEAENPEDVTNKDPKGTETDLGSDSQDLDSPEDSDETDLDDDDLASEPECKSGFDPDEPYGEVSSEGRAKYWQNGKYYDNQHNVVPDDEA